MKADQITQPRSPFRDFGILSMTVLAFCCAISLVVAQTEAQPDPTDVLKKEHAIIQKMADAAEAASEEIKRTGRVDAVRMAQFHDFFRNFVDRCHHAKEEEELFPVLREMNVDSVVIDLLIKQHEEGRILLAGTEDSLAGLADDRSEADTEALRRYIFEYSQLMHRHIRTENEYLWPRAAAKLSDVQKDALAEAFHRIEVEDLGRGFHEKYHALATDVLKEETSP